MKELIVLTTVPTLEFAKILANSLVKDKLAACINIVPKVISVFEWEEDLCEEEELLLIIKTTQNKYSKLESKIVATHPYEVPEVIALPIKEGSPIYLEWLNKILK